MAISLIGEVTGSTTGTTLTLTLSAANDFGTPAVGDLAVVALETDTDQYDEANSTAGWVHIDGNSPDTVGGKWAQCLIKPLTADDIADDDVVFARVTAAGQTMIGTLTVWRSNVRPFADDSVFIGGVAHRTTSIAESIHHLNGFVFDQAGVALSIFVDHDGQASGGPGLLPSGYTLASNLRVADDPVFVRSKQDYQQVAEAATCGNARYGTIANAQVSQWLIAINDPTDSPAMPPRITNLAPKPGSDLAATWQAARFTPITFDVDPDVGADVVWIEVWVKYANASLPVVVYDGAQFFDPFTTRSSKSFDAGVTSFSILPAAGWLTTVERLVIRAWNDDGEVNGMIAYFADSAQVELGTAALTIDVPAPTDLQQGDVLVCGIGLGDDNEIAATPSGWTQDDNSPVEATDGGTTYRLAVFRRVIDGDPGDEPAEYTWATTDTKAMAAAVVVVRDANPDDPVDASAASATADTVTTTSHVAPSVTTSKAERHLVHVYYAAAGTSFTPAASTTEREDAASADHTVMIATGDVGAAGATPTRTAVSADAAHGCWMTIAFNPLIEREAV